MKIQFLKKFRNFKAGETFEVARNRVNYWVGRNGSGKSTLAALILTALKNHNKKLVPSYMWMATLNDKDVADISGLKDFTGLSFISDKLRQTQMLDMGALMDMGLTRIWASEGQNSQQDVCELAKHMKDPNHLTILDETDGHLDYSSKVIFFEGLLRNIRGTVIVISHDSFFLKNKEVLDFDDKKVKSGEQYYQDCEDKVRKNSPSQEKVKQAGF